MNWERRNPGSWNGTEKVEVDRGRMSLRRQEETRRTLDLAQGQGVVHAIIFAGVVAVEGKMKQLGVRSELIEQKGAGNRRYSC